MVLLVTGATSSDRCRLATPGE
ncbi:hypothetical protein A2U01_0103361, partial [Trifolium medium]|nr:hypothetical protein [Trifolium medium]